MIAAELYTAISLPVLREMFASSYFALGAAEKAVVDQAVFAQVSASYQALTRENFKSKQLGHKRISRPQHQKQAASHVCH